MATGDLYRVSVEYSISSQTNVNVLYLKETRILSTSNAKNCAEDTALILKDLYGNVLSTSSRAANILVKAQLVSRLFTDAGERLIALNGSPGVVLTLPPANAVVMRLKTGQASRRKRGRIYIGGVPSDRVQDGVLNTSGQLLYNTFATGLLSNFAGANPVSGFSLGIFSRENYKPQNALFTDYWTPVNQVQLAGAVATMRSRKVGVGS